MDSDTKQSEQTVAMALEAIRVRMTRVFPQQLRQCVAELSDEQLWWRPNEESNSVGNLVLHLSGSLNHYLNRGLGGIPYDRNREAEFAERRTIPRDELMAIFDEMIRHAEETFAGINTARLAEPSPEQKQYSVIFEELIGMVTHVAAHVGQIIWITKMLKAESLDDIWMKVHKNEGGWKAS